MISFDCLTSCQGKTENFSTLKYWQEKYCDKTSKKQWAIEWGEQEEETKTEHDWDVFAVVDKRMVRSDTMKIGEQKQIVFEFNDLDVLQNQMFQRFHRITRSIVPQICSYIQYLDTTQKSGHVGIVRKNNDNISLQYSLCDCNGKTQLIITFPHSNAEDKSIELIRVFKKERRHARHEVKLLNKIERTSISGNTIHEFVYEPISSIPDYLWIHLVENKPSRKRKFKKANQSKHE